MYSILKLSSLIIFPQQNYLHSSRNVFASVIMLHINVIMNDDNSRLTNGAKLLGLYQGTADFQTIYVAYGVGLAQLVATLVRSTKLLYAGPG